MAAFASVIWTTLHKLIGRSQPVRLNKHKLPLPACCHLELSNEDIEGRSVFVIGDVHGCFDELTELIQQAERIEQNILYIFVGDLVNKGPKNKQVLQLVKSMGAYSVRGNHDEAILRELRNYSSDPMYKLPEKYQWILDLSHAEIDFLQQLPYTIGIPALQALIVHAGIVPGKSLQLQDLNDLTNMRNIEETTDVFYNHTFIGSSKHHVGVPWTDLWSGPDHVFFGHDARRGYQKATFATGLDTGCVYGMKLTGQFINNSRIVLSVDAHTQSLPESVLGWLKCE